MTFLWENEMLIKEEKPWLGKFKISLVPVPAGVKTVKFESKNFVVNVERSNLNDLNTLVHFQ